MDITYWFKKKVKNVKILNIEMIAGLEGLDAYTGFQRRTEKTKINLIEYLIKIRKEGKQILAYGAAARDALF